MGDGEADDFDYSPDREDEQRPTKVFTRTPSSIKKSEVKRKQGADFQANELSNIVPIEVQVNTETAENLFSKFE